MKNPATNEYSIVMTYAKDDNICKYINSNYERMNWYKTLEYLCGIIEDLRKIHDEGFLHHDLHPGNIYYIIFLSLPILDLPAQQI